VVGWRRRLGAGLGRTIWGSNPIAGTRRPVGDELAEHGDPLIVLPLEDERGAERRSGIRKIADRLAQQRDCLRMLADGHQLGGERHPCAAVGPAVNHRPPEGQRIGVLFVSRDSSGSQPREHERRQTGRRNHLRLRRFRVR